MLAEVKVLGKIAKLGNAFAYCGSLVRPLVGFRVNPLASKEIILYEFSEGIEAEDLAVNITFPCIGANNKARHAQAITVLVHFRRDNVVIESTPIVPGQEYRGAVPIRALHYRIDYAGCVSLASAHKRRRMLAVY